MLGFATARPGQIRSDSQATANTSQSIRKVGRCSTCAVTGRYDGYSSPVLTIRIGRAQGGFAADNVQSGQGVQIVTHAIVHVALGAAVVVFASGCSKFGGEPTAESVTKGLIELLDEFAETLANVHDRDSARAAASKIEGLVEKRNQLQNELTRIRRAGMSAEESQRIQELYGDQLKASIQRVVEETNRLRRNPHVWSAIASQMAAPPVQHSGGNQQLGIGYDIIAQYGQARTLSVIVENLPRNCNDELARVFKEMCQPKAVSITGDNNTFKMVCGPVDDMQAVVSQIDFGEVVESDFGTGFIRIEADPARLPKPLPAAVTDSNDPNFYERNYEDLKGVDDRRAAEAIDRLLAVEPGALRNEIATAAKQLVNTQDSPSKQALLLTIRYAEDDYVPMLVDLLEHKSVVMRWTAAECLGETKDPRAMKVLAELMVTDKDLAERGLRKAGEAGQDAISVMFRHPDAGVRAGAVRIAGEIANGEIVLQLCGCLEDADRTVRREALEVLGRLRDERAVSPVCKLLMSEQDRHSAGQCLVEMGSMVEGAVVKGLKHSDAAVVQACCGVLKEVGTEKCLPALRQAAQSANPSARSFISWAEEDIEKTSVRRRSALTHLEQETQEW